jgi:multidrug resistance efflux pump
MPENTPIPSPFAENWRRFRWKSLQFIGFFVVCLGIAWAWQQMARPLTFPGQVEIVQANVVATEAGVLTNLWVSSYQQVKTGDPIAEINASDSHAVNTRVEAMRLTLDRLALAADSGAGSNAAFRDAVRREQDKIQALEAAPTRLLAPMSGAVTAIHRHPGEHILPGQPVVTITSQDSQRIVGFVPPTFPVPPQAGMKVTVSAKSGGKKQGTGAIIAIGPQLESITNVLAYSATARMAVTQPFGRPVSISLPPGMNLLPGEPLEIRLLP